MSTKTERAVAERRALLPEPGYLTSAQAAAYANLSLRRLEKLREHGDGPPVIYLSRRRVLYAKATLDTWLLAKQGRRP